MTSSLASFGELVLIGRIIKPQGRKGEVVVAPVSDQPGRFPALRHVYVPDSTGGARTIAIQSCWPHKGRFVLKIEGVDSIDQAEDYRGVELRIAEEDLSPLDAGSYYHHQLRGLSVDDSRGQSVGIVREILETGSAPVLVIDGAKGEVLVPLADAFVREINLPSGKMVINRPEYVDAD